MGTDVPDKDLAILVNENLIFANSYYSTLLKGVTIPSKFNNSIRYNMVLICLEKYFIALLSCYNTLPTNHTPVGLYNEALMVVKSLTASIKQTCILIGKFENICSFEGSGYQTPSDEDLKQMILGLKEIKELTERITDEGI